MADIEKMREVFEEALKAIGEIAPFDEFSIVDKTTNELRTRFNEAVMAKQNEQPIVVNIAGALLQGEDELMKRINKAIKEALWRYKQDNNLGILSSNTLSGR